MLMTRAEKLILENQSLIMTALSLMLQNQHVMTRCDLVSRISKTNRETVAAKHLTGDTK